VIQQVVAQPLKVPISEFLTYYLFYRKRYGVAGYESYAAIRHRVGTATAELDDFIDYNGHSICRAAGVIGQPNYVSEHIGEAIGLSVVNRIHNLHEADWMPIPEQRGYSAAPVLDFGLASDGIGSVQVENKGSATDDNRRREAIRTHKWNIEQKKLKLAERGTRRADPHPASVRYGAITVIDARREGNVRCWLTDPTPEEVDEAPRSSKLRQRMRFLGAWIAFVSPRAPFASALGTRIATVEQVQDPFELSGVALRRGDGKPFKFRPLRRGGIHSTYLANRSRITDGPADGVVMQLLNGGLFLAGFREELVTLAADQDFERIIAYRYEAATIKKSVECVFSRSRFRSLSLPRSVRLRESGGYVSFLTSGQIHYSPGGLASLWPPRTAVRVERGGTRN
jgi:hypothetical protein